MYSTDVARMVQAPIFHVNGDDPEAVARVAELAFGYRQEFHRDVVIDLVCYRRRGHNEGDDPSFTQPIMASLIKKKPSTLKVYAERLLSDSVITEDDVEQIRSSLDEQMERAQSKAAENPFDPTIDPGSWRWQGMGTKYEFGTGGTGVSREQVEEVARALSHMAQGLQVAPHAVEAAGEADGDDSQG